MIVSFHNLIKSMFLVWGEKRNEKKRKRREKDYNLWGKSTDAFN